MGFNQRKLKANTELILGDANLFALSTDRMPFDVLSCLKKRNSLSFMDNRAWSRQLKARFKLTSFDMSSSRRLVSEVNWWWCLCLSGQVSAYTAARHTPKPSFPAS